MEQRFEREIKSLDKIFGFVDGFATSNAIDESVAYIMNFVIEEIFTNMVKYNPTSRSEILIDLKKDGKTLTISVTDFDSDPFDLTKAGEVDIHQSLRDRKVGGLGIHLVKKMVDTVDYEYQDRQSKVTLTKRLEK